MRLSLIVAMSRNRAIGRAGTLPWRLSDDLKRFKQLTMGHPIIMGRKTFESIGKPLPGRTSIVVTRQADFHPPNVLVSKSLSDAIRLAASKDDQEAFVVGGGEIYAAALPLVDRLYVTSVDAHVEGDTYFPEWEQRDWHLIEETYQPSSEKNSYDCRFLVYDRAAGN